MSPYLWSRGIKKIDIVVLSHPHEDHLGGLFAVVRNFQIGEFWHAANSASLAYSGLLERVRQKGIAERTLAAGDELQRGRRHRARVVARAVVASVRSSFQ